MKTITIWILVGALIASLRWNLGSASPSVDPRLGAAPANNALECEIDPIELGLSPDQCEALETLCQTRIGEQEDFENRAKLKLAELRAQLGAADLNEEELRALVDEVSELRESALGACVDEILRVRTILDAPQVERLMESCCPTESCSLPGELSD